MWSARTIPWATLSSLLSDKREQEKKQNIGDIASGSDGRLSYLGQKPIDLSEKYATISYVVARKGFLQWNQSAIRITGSFSGFSVGVDSRSPYLDAVTDRAESVSECRTLCVNTKTCRVFTYYYDGRFDANCVLKSSVLKKELFFHPVAITADKDTTDALLCEFQQ